jgi:hypothetical protein
VADIATVAPTTRDHNGSESPARSMDRHRTRFLASLSARLERDRALRESEADTPSLWHRQPEPPDSTGEPAIDESPEADLAADIPEPAAHTTRAEVVALRRSPGRRDLGVEALRGQRPDQTPSPAVPWSETGMSQALRDAIASVRRVSHHAMPERPPARADRGRSAPRRFDDSAVEQASFGLAESDAQPSFEDQELRRDARFDHPAAAERFDEHALDEEAALADTRADPQQSLEPAAAADEWAARSADWADEPVSLAEDAAQFDDGPDAPRRFGGRARPRRSSLNAPAGWRAPPGADAAAEERSSDDGWDEEAPPGLQEDSPGRVPLWRGVTQRPRLHVAAVLVPLFVLVAGVGVGILSGAQGFDRVLTTLGWTSLADGSMRAAPTQPAPPAASSARSPTSGAEPPPASMPSAADVAASPAEPAPPPQLSELETVRVAPLPAPPNDEQSPADPQTSDMPLPPPPKPAPWSSLPGEASAPNDRIDVDAAAGAVLAADGTPNDTVADAAVTALEDDGAGGPFEPILIKSSASEPRVFVHYTESGAGSPATALHLVRQLRAAGFKVEERPVEVSIAENSIRYFFPGDRDEAEVLSAQLQSQVPGGAAVTILDLTSYEPKPRQGHLEVWLGG